MNQATCLVETWEALLELGFKPDPMVRSERVVGLSYDFGGFQVGVGRMMNLQMREVLNFSGIVSTTRSLASIEFEMPLQIESIEQCAAWVTWHLQKHLPVLDSNLSGQQSRLISLGLEHQATLPWIRRQAAYAARPRCTAKREWFRLAMKELKEALLDAADADDVLFYFDGVVLHLRCKHLNIACPATGSAWPNRYAIAAQSLRNLPKRLMCETSSIDVWDGRLHIDRYAFAGVRELSLQTA